MRPEPVPTLRGRHAREFAKQIEQPPSAQTIQIFEEAKEVSRKIKQVR
jgi:hypothetical protein